MYDIATKDVIILKFFLFYVLYMNKILIIESQMISWFFGILGLFFPFFNH